MDCEKCNRPQPVDFQTHQADMARMERANRRLFILLIIALVMLLLTNIGWVWYESQFETVSEMVQQEVDTGEGDAWVAGGNLIYGQSATDGND